MADITLPTLPRALAAATGAPAPSYRTLYAAALDGRIPAYQRTGRWYIDDGDIPAIAAALGLPLVPAAKRASAKTKAPPPSRARAGVTA